jgi:hypothetical protein
MSNPSPGPGWWLASDGKWYPQRWEYKSPFAYNQASMDDAIKAIRQIVDEMGQQGWEMVSSNVYCNQSKAVDYGKTGGGNIYNLNLQNGLWGIVCFMKRPIAP